MRTRNYLSENIEHAIRLLNLDNVAEAKRQLEWMRQIAEQAEGDGEQPAVAQQSTSTNADDERPLTRLHQLIDQLERHDRETTNYNENRNALRRDLCKRIRHLVNVLEVCAWSKG